MPVARVSIMNETKLVDVPTTEDTTTKTTTLAHSVSISSDLPGLHGSSSTASLSLSSATATTIDKSTTTNNNNNKVVIEEEPFSSNVDHPIPKGAQNLCSASLGAKILFATDEWFATADNLLKDTPPEFDEDAYCPQGKVMDGWESRRRREEGHDWCLIQLATPPPSSSSSSWKLHGIELDTAHFTGNHTPQVSIEMATLSDSQWMQLVVPSSSSTTSMNTPCSSSSTLPQGLERMIRGGKGIQGTGHTPQEVQQAQSAISSIPFQEILPKTPLRPGVEATRYHYFPLVSNTDTTITTTTTTTNRFGDDDDDGDGPTVGNLLKVNYFPDGGVARLKLWVVESNDDTKEEEEVEEEESTRRPTKRAKISSSSSTPSLYMPITTGPICTVVSHFDVIPSELPSQIKTSYLELSSQSLGGKGIGCSNQHYGEPWRLVQSSLGKGMWDGWETARHPNRPSNIVQDPITKLSIATSSSNSNDDDNNDDDHTKHSSSSLSIHGNLLHDWCLLQLGQPASEEGIRKVILDTQHFLGNYPESVTLEGCCWKEKDEEEKKEDDSINPTDGTTSSTSSISSSDSTSSTTSSSTTDKIEKERLAIAMSKQEWFPLVARTRLSPHAEHVFETHQLLNTNRTHVTHVRLSIFPDGGVSRVRVYGA